MIAKNTTMNACCMACLNHQGQKKVVDTYFENKEDNDCVVVLFHCQACGGITKETFRLWAGSYVSGPRKSIYKKGE